MSSGRRRSSGNAVAQLSSWIPSFSIWQSWPRRRDSCAAYVDASAGEKIVLENLLHKYGAAVSPSGEGLNPVVGEADDPENQRQFLLTLPLSSEGNAVVYGAAGGGKTTFITTLLYGFCVHTMRAHSMYTCLTSVPETLRAFF